MELIDLGNAADDGSGSDLREAGEIINNNFTTLEETKATVEQAQAAANGVVWRETLAEVNAISPLVENTVYGVYDDGGNNGYYYWDGTSSTVTFNRPLPFDALKKSHIFPLDNRGDNSEIIANAIKYLFVKNLNISDFNYYLPSVRNIAGECRIEVFKRLKGTTTNQLVARYLRDEQQTGVQKVKFETFNTEHYAEAVIDFDLLTDLNQIGVFDPLEGKQLMVDRSDLFDQWIKANVIPNNDFSQGLNAVNYLGLKYWTDVAMTDTFQLKSDFLRATSKSTSFKGIQVGISMDEGWADKLGLKGGDILKYGAYVNFGISNSASVAKWGYSGFPLPAEEVTYSPTFKNLAVNEIPTDGFEWVERTVTLKENFDINQKTYLSLAYVQLTDSEADVTPNTIDVKGAILITNQERLNLSEDVDNVTEVLSLDNAVIDSASIGQSFIKKTFLGKNREAEFEDVNVTRNLKTKRIELTNNLGIPSEGIFLSVINGKLTLTIDGINQEIQTVE